MIKYILTKLGRMGWENILLKVIILFSTGINAVAVTLRRIGEVNKL